MNLRPSERQPRSSKSRIKNLVSADNLQTSDLLYHQLTRCCQTYEGSNPDIMQLGVFTVLNIYIICNFSFGYENAHLLFEYDNMFENKLVQTFKIYNRFLPVSNLMFE